MIKIKAFKFDESDKASEFITEHPPTSDEKQSGIIFTMSHIVIKYDDGEFNSVNLTNKWKISIEREIENIAVQKHNITKNKNKLKNLTPKGYKNTMSVEELIKLCAVQDGVEVSQGRINTLVSLGRADEETQKREFSRMTIDEIKLANRVNQIVLLENQVRQFVEDTQNSQDEIDHYQQSIKEYDSK